MKDIVMNFCIVMITMNEEKAIKQQIEEIHLNVNPKIPILIIDSSCDNTPQIAKSMGVKVIRQFPPQGYGKAMKIGLLEAAKDFEAVVTMDCDLTYPAKDINNFISLLEKGFDCVSGSRLKGSNKGMPFLNKLGNLFFATLVQFLFGLKTSDLTTGMRAYKSDILTSINWVPLRFFPCELALRIHQGGYKTCEIPIEYTKRIGEVKMRKFRDLMLLVQAILYCKFIPVTFTKSTKLKEEVL